ncbi:non-homologous end-joining DNA ligase [Clostridium sp. D2Q-11]|uniref:Non-homologous end-joining DNA ligase n=1 Tax=Anaeromonas frigoriresistens TaxID=2683708 RepID=A0A942UZS1_9FIRM|nr:non-homologous end-joining DNA ligase [Anaeromonas frigoriresistens]MBS4537452.1 non-homologous end-joining DNA ligase [Anaeromonas frigoriresistens]
MQIYDKKIEIKNTDKVLFPKTNITKGDLIDYFDKISKYMLPHIKNRPLTMHRFPNGIEDIDFYEKQIPSHFPSWFNRIDVKNKSKGYTIYPLCDDKLSLVYLANQACISHHIWLTTKNSLECPDKMIFDLDPPKKGNFSIVIKAAKSLKKVLEEKSLVPYVMTTGSSGLHIVVPIKQEKSFDEIREIAKDISQEVVNKDEDLYTIEQRKEKRENKIFIDYLRNAYGQTSIAPYSIRSKEHAPVATPLDWNELDGDLTPTKYNIKNIFRRLGQKEDPWKDMYHNKRTIKKMG